MYLKWIKYIHGYCISTLICQVPANSCSNLLISLSDVYWLSIVIKKSIHAIFASPQRHFDSSNWVDHWLAKKRCKIFTELGGLERSGYLL